jgi:putative aminopeptidase FrvX
MNALIKQLTETWGPSGREDAIRKLILAEIEDHVDSTTISPLGSLHAIVNPGGDLKVMLAAHIDEIGIIVSHIDQNGFARFHLIGGADLNTFPGHRVRFEDGTLAVIGVEKRLKRTKPFRLEETYLDFGVRSAQECPVKVGDLGTFDRSFVALGDRLIAKSLDDRIGVAILIETIRKLKHTPHEIQFVFTVQEEVGRRGAGPSAYGLDPDLAIAVDVTRTGDTPRGPKMAVELGSGPAIKVRDRHMISDPRIVDLMVKRAEDVGIPFQFEVLESGSTDASIIQLTRAGVPAGCLSIPCRYVHTPSEMVDKHDVENAVHLLIELLSNPIKLKQ